MLSARPGTCPLFMTQTTSQKYSLVKYRLRLDLGYQYYNTAGHKYAY